MTFEELAAILIDIEIDLDEPEYRLWLQKDGRGVSFSGDFIRSNLVLFLFEVCTC
mgnify:CR=1 FL=1